MDDKPSLFDGGKKAIGIQEMKVCIVCPVYHPGLGGIGRQAVSLTEELHRRGINLFVITRKLEGVSSFKSDIKSIKVWAFRPHAYRIEKKTVSNLLTSVTFSLNLLFALAKRRKDYDMVHFHGAGIPLLITLPFLKFIDKKIVAKVSSAKLGIEAGSFYNKYGIIGRLFIRILKIADAFVAISDEIKEGLLTEGYKQNRVWQIPNFVDLSVFFQTHRNQSNSKTVIFSGALDRRKGIEILLEALKEVSESVPDVRLIILGDGLMRDALKAKANDLGIGGIVTFKGQVENVSDYLRNAGLFVLPSYQEGLPNSLLEAMACGLPVIASKIGGVVDVVEDGKSGILFEPGDVSRLASAMIKLLNDNELRMRLGKEARKRIVDSFSIDRIADEYISLYERLLK